MNRLLGKWIRRMGASPASKYDSWTKEQLIERVLELEGKRRNGNAEEASSTSISAAAAKTSAAIPSTPPVNTRPTKKKKEMDFSKFATRKIAIRFAYLGWNYNGLAVQHTNGQLPDSSSNDISNRAGSHVRTVEGCILEAFYKTKVITSTNPSECEFSRCGRTDAGVSAMRQVISLSVRSNLTPDQQQDPANDHRELDYLRILNNLLPSDIIAYEICLRPPKSFDARFSCTFRHYRYYFDGAALDIERMRQASAQFVGVHDFRNFCKVDGSKQITNFKREMVESTIVKVDAEENSSSSLYYFNLKGTAFLWHQVRSMMAILFLVGQKLEDASIVSQLLDVESNPRRPVYPMAADYPLVLYDCGFSDIEWQSCKTMDGQTQMRNTAFNVSHEQNIKRSMCLLFKDTTFRHSSASEEYVPPRDKIWVNLGSGLGKPTGNYRRLFDRELMATPEEVNVKWKAAKAKKGDGKAAA